MEFIVFALVMGAICSAIGYAVAVEEKKTLGAVLGFLLGPLGVLIAAVMRK